MSLSALADNPNSREILRYGVAGLTNTMVGLITYSAFILLTPIPFWGANFCAMIAGIVCGFILSRYFVFAATTASHKTAAPKYIATIGLQYFVSTTLIGLFIQAGLSDITSYVACLPIVIVLSFVLQKIWVFQTPKTTL